jgi:hypothetical protein
MPKERKARTVSYTVIAPVGPGRLRKSGSFLSLLFSIPYFFVSEVIPPIYVINDILKKSTVDAGMSGGCRWKPFQLNAEEYADLVSELKERNFADIAPPEWVKSHSDWHTWCCEITWGIPALEQKRRWEEITSSYSRLKQLQKDNPVKAAAMYARITYLSNRHTRWMNKHRLPEPKLPLFRSNLAGT